MKRSVVRRGVVASVFVMTLGLVARRCRNRRRGLTEVHRQEVLTVVDGWDDHPTGGVQQLEPERRRRCHGHQPRAGQTSGTFRLTWDTQSVPDRIDVRYQGAVIFTTGGPSRAWATCR